MRILELRAVPMGTVLNLRTTTSPKCEAVPKGARIQGSYHRLVYRSTLGSRVIKKKVKGHLPIEVEALGGVLFLPILFGGD